MHTQAALDVGCGSNGRFIELLGQHGFAVEGLDVSARMLELAQQRHPTATFQLADVCEWTPARSYDFISAWDSIWHVPLSAQQPVLNKLFGCLAPEGVCIFTMGGLDTAAEKTDSAMGPQMYYSTLGVSKVLQLVEAAGCTCRHLEFDQYPEPHVYLIVQRTPATMSTLRLGESC